MTHFDVFNGDADGLCALHQLRLADPRDAVLVTGPKRAIGLLDQVPAGAGDSVTVLDLSLHANRPALDALLARGVRVEYFDHHYAGTIPAHPALCAHIDTSSDVCTGMIVDRTLQGRFRPWAIVAAFGDNLAVPARRLGTEAMLAGDRIDALRELGEVLAYNAYGDDAAELIVPPAELYRAMRPHRDPWTFMAEQPIWRAIATRRAEDLELARRVAARYASDHAVVIVLPDLGWSRRARGALANELIDQAPDRACAVLSPIHGGGYTVSVRAARNRPRGADELCRMYASGGGRAAAGGINHLGQGDLEAFIEHFVAALG